MFYQHSNINILSKIKCKYFINIVKYFSSIVNIMSIFKCKCIANSQSYYFLSAFLSTLDI